MAFASAIGFPLAAQEQPAPGEARPTTADIPLEGARFLAVGGSVTYDSNFFRDPGLVRSLESETITTAYAGIRIDKPYAQQRFYLDVTATAYRYDNFSELDFDGLNYFGAWYWSVTPSVIGTISAGRTQTPTQFEYTLSRQSNVVTEENYAFNLVGNALGRWRILLGASQVDRTSEQSSLQSVPDYMESRAEAGIRYVERPGNQIDAMWRRIEGEQVGQVIGSILVAGSDNYMEDQAELVATWGASEKSTLLSRITYLDRRYELTPQFDFSGTAGEIRYSWLPTSKTSLVLTATRDLAPFQGGVQANYRVTNTLTVAPAWQPTVTTRLHLTARVSDEQYPLAAGSVAEREDTITSTRLGFDWRAARNLSIDANITWEQRASNVALVEYEVTLGRISATLIF